MRSEFISATFELDFLRDSSRDSGQWGEKESKKSCKVLRVKKKRFFSFLDRSPLGIKIEQTHFKFVFLGTETINKSNEKKAWKCAKRGDKVNLDVVMLRELCFLGIVCSGTRGVESMKIIARNNTFRLGHHWLVIELIDWSLIIDHWSYLVNGQASSLPIPSALSISQAISSSHGKAINEEEEEN